MIGCINFIRSEVAAGRDPRPALRNLGRGSPVPWADEQYLQPVLAEDPLLFYDWQDEAPPPGSAGAAGCALVPRQVGRQAAQGAVQAVLVKEDCVRGMGPRSALTCAWQQVGCQRPYQT